MTGDNQNFTATEWAFHKIPHSELRASWLWELERTLGSGGDPWLVLSEEVKRHIKGLVPGQRSTAVDEYGLDRACPEFVHLFETLYHEKPGNVHRSPGHNRLHLLQVDWSRSKTKILGELSEWVERHSATVPVEVRNPEKGGRKEQFGAWLVDLAIYRASEAGLKRSEAVKVLAPLFAGATTTQTGKTSPSHWEDAQQRIRKRLSRRLLELEVRATVLNEDEAEAKKHNYPKEWQGYLLVNRMLRH